MDIIRFIEIERFRKKLDTLSDLSFVFKLQDELIENPLKGDVIQGAGGVRKIRMRAEGRGKSGGSRVIYYYLDLRGEIWFLDIYNKSKQENISSADKKLFKQMVKEIENE